MELILAYEVKESKNTKIGEVSAKITTTDLGLVEKLRDGIRKLTEDQTFEWNGWDKDKIIFKNKEGRILNLFLIVPSKDKA